MTQDSKLPLPAEDLGLFTDLYELTMAQAFFQQEMFQPATFSLFIRTYPPNRGYFVFAGLEDVLEYLSNLYFSDSSLSYLRSTGIFQDDLYSKLLPRSKFPEESVHTVFNGLQWHFDFCSENVHP